MAQALNRSGAWRQIKAAYRAAGVHGQTGTHSLRKTYCLKVYRALNNDLVATGAAMRHANIGSTIRYLSFDAAGRGRYFGGLISSCLMCQLRSQYSQVAGDSAVTSFDMT